MKKTIRFVYIILCESSNEREWIEQVVCKVNDSEEDILNIISNLLVRQEYNMNNIALEVMTDD